MNKWYKDVVSVVRGNTDRWSMRLMTISYFLYVKLKEAGVIYDHCNYLLIQ